MCVLPTFHQFPLDFTCISIKTFISLYFGTNEGEGGSFALYQGLFPPREIDYDDERTLTGISVDKEGSSPPAYKSFKDRLRWPLLLLVSAGCSPP